MLQRAVDGLIDNRACDEPVMGPRDRVLSSLADSLSSAIEKNRDRSTVLHALCFTDAGTEIDAL